METKLSRNCNLILSYFKEDMSKYIDYAVKFAEESLCSNEFFEITMNMRNAYSVLMKELNNLEKEEEIYHIKKEISKFLKIEIFSIRPLIFWDRPYNCNGSEVKTALDLIIEEYPEMENMFDANNILEDKKAMPIYA